MEDGDNELVAENNLDCTAKWPDHTQAAEASGCNLVVEAGCNLPAEAGCNLPAEVQVEGDAVLVDWTWSTCGYWSTRTFGELLVESRRQSHGNDCGSTDNEHNRGKQRWK